VFSHVSRSRAFWIHLVASILVFSSFLLVMRFVWYPGPFFTAEGGLDIIAVVGGVDVVLGPLLTFIVFKPGKRGLKFDLAVIVLIQLAALMYGGKLIFNERPAYAVLVDNKFVVVSAAELATARNRDNRVGIFSGPQYAVSMFHHDVEMRNKFQNRLALGTAAEVAANLPELLGSYDEHARFAVEAGQPVSLLAAHSDEYARKIEQFLSSQNIAGEDIVYLPFTGKLKTMALILRKSDGEILGAVDVDPQFQEADMK